MQQQWMTQQGASLILKDRAQTKCKIDLFYVFLRKQHCLEVLPLQFFQLRQNNILPCFGTSSISLCFALNKTEILWKNNSSKRVALLLPYCLDDNPRCNTRSLTVASHQDEHQGRFFHFRSLHYLHYTVIVKGNKRMWLTNKCEKTPSHRQGE